MKKAKLTLGIALSALSCTLAAGCNGATYSPQGYILTYTNSAGETTHYTAQDLFGSYYDDSSKVSTMFDSIYKVIVRNYFTGENAGKSKYSEILKNAKNDVEGVKAKANENAKTNSTSYDDEWNSLLQSYSCDDEKELLEHFIYERELTEFNDQFYDNNTDHLRDSKPGDGGDGYEGYIHKNVPYHVRHILVKISDSGTTNYWNSTIDKDNAIKLYDVASKLANGNDTFGKIAQQYSDDGSATSYGDLGIMDKTTSFVNEFKLGIYAYENLFNQNTSAAAADSKIGISTDIATKYNEQTTNNGKIGSIPYGVFVALNEYKDVTKDTMNRDVNDGNSNFFPRNVYFNKYLNNHYISVIRPTDVATADTPQDFSSLPGFQEVQGLGKVLCTKDGQPILVVRAGTSDYQGIHFIVIQRTPLIDEIGNVKLSEYYTTKYPGQEGYPQDESGNDKQTYVNFLNQEVKEYKTRAEKVETTIKNFDSNLNKYIYSRYLNEEKISIKDEKLKNKINTWISSTYEKADFDEEISWNQTWGSYIESLSVQKTERSKAIPEVCAIKFTTHPDEYFGEGKPCYDNKNR